MFWVFGTFLSSCTPKWRQMEINTSLLCGICCIVENFEDFQQQVLTHIFVWRSRLLFFVQFQVWDLGGQTSIRPYWRCYYPNTDAIIFVVDSADSERMPVARGELAAMLEEDELKDAILLVFANKQDQKGAMNAQQISDALGLPEIRNRQWSIQETSALKGKGLFEGFDWLVTCIKGTEEQISFLFLCIRNTFGIPQIFLVLERIEIKSMSDFSLDKKSKVARLVS